MKTLVLVEHDGQAVKDATLATVTAAGQLGDVELLVAGQGVGAVADAAAKIAGVSKVLVADDAAYANLLAENVAKLPEQHLAVRSGTDPSGGDGPGGAEPLGRPPLRVMQALHQTAPSAQCGRATCSMRRGSLVITWSSIHNWHNCRRRMAPDRRCPESPA